MYWLIPGAILCGWVLLRLMGAERQAQLQTMRQLVEQEQQLQRPRKPAQDSTDPSDIPTLSSPLPELGAPVPITKSV